MQRRRGVLTTLAYLCLATICPGAIICAFSLSPAAALAQDSGYITVVLGPERTIRQVAEEYLGDPDLWPEILRASGFESVTELTPESELKIPATEVSTANKALAEALLQIQTANLAGAQIFAPDHIGRAIGLYDDALSLRRRWEWLQTRNRAAESHAEATTALEISEAERNEAAEALLTDRNGSVEGLRPEDLSWRDLLLQAILIEQEKVRTLSNSTAQITFRDASKLRLNANSTAVIQQMQVNLLTRQEDAKVSLIEGDFYALLPGESTRKAFNLEIPGVDATIESGSFWVSNDAKFAKFANYDYRPVQVAAAGGSVILGANEGTVVQQGDKAEDKVTVLPPPDLTAPADNATLYERALHLDWAAAPAAAGYWLELASDQGFDRMVLSRFGLDQPGFAVEKIEPGNYFWRVAVLDQFGLPGERSAIWRFKIAIDQTPPYLTIERPAADAILREAALDVVGQSEPGAVVTVNDNPVVLEDDGRYAASLSLAEGSNRIVVIATDAAGNTTTKERAVAFMPDRRAALQFDPTIPQVDANHFVTSDAVISLSGATTAGSTLEVRTADDKVRASAVADPEGRFGLNLPLLEDEESFTLAVIALSGYTTLETFRVTIDRTAPEIALDRPPPRLVAEPVLVLHGRTEEGAKLLHQGLELATEAGSFQLSMELQPGPNIVELIAADRVGNVRVERWTVMLDQDPPVFVSSQLKRKTAGGKTTLSIQVMAEDASGLAAAAPFTVVAGEKVFEGYLRYDRASKAYAGSLVVPEAEGAKAKLREVELTDDAGNRKSFTVN